MDFESPDVEKDFPGLYASESGRKSNESDFSDGGEHDKPSKKGLLGRQKDKKESKKDRGYAALEGESSPEEDTDTKSPSKSKKTKSFKFPTKSKEKREKSRDKEKVLEEAVKQQQSDKEKKKEKEKEKKEKEKKEKLKEKDKEKEEKAKFKLESKEKLKDDKKDKSKEKEKDKSKDKEKEKVKEKEKEKVKDKEKDKGKEKEKEKTKDKEKEKSKEKEKEKVKEKDKDKTKKLTKMPSTITSGVPFEEIFTIGVALPIFGVPLHQSVERMPCHDQTRLPLVVRDSIDYLQEHGLTSPQIYRAEADKIKLQQLRTLYTDRGAIFPYHYDVPVACAMLKMFLGELPDSILTQELHSQFEQATALSEPQRSASIVSTLTRLANTAPVAHTVLSWLICHLAAVLSHEQVNHASIQTLTSALCPALNMSPSLLAYFILNAKTFFPNVELTKYVPPLQSVPTEWSEGAEAEQLSSELRKQESLLGVLHAELLAGVHPHLDLWAAQRVVTQLKRQLRAMQKSAEPNNQPPQQQPSEEKQTEAEKSPNVTETIPTTTKLETPKISKDEIRESPKPQEAVFDAEFEDNFEEETNPEITKEIENPQVTEISDKPKLSENELKKLRLELENAEYLQLKSLLQAKINSEQFEIVKLRSQVALKNKQENAKEKDNNTKDTYTAEEQELRQKLMKENATLEQKRMNLINQIFQERVACIQLKIELAMKELH